jgi:N-acetylglucosaminyl-diphospho-decaprenol L-rhamnosyltransferase
VTAADDIRSHARVLNLRLRLGLVELAVIERWADQAILTDNGVHTELVDLCLAGKKGVKTTQALLSLLGGPVKSDDLMSALWAAKVDGLSGDEMRHLADNLDPVLKELQSAGDLPEMLKPALTFATDFWHARMQGDGTLQRVEQEMRVLLHELKEHAAELPNELDPEEKNAVELKGVSAIVVSYRTGEVLFECLAALEADSQIDEIVLVDNGNPEEVKWRIDELTGSSKKLKVTGGGQNRGFAAGVNLGVKESKGLRLLIINPDAVLQPRSVAAMEAARATFAEPIIVGGRIYGEDGKEQRGGRRRRLTIASAAATFLGMTWLRSLNPAFVNFNRNQEPPPDGPTPMDAVSGAFMYMSRQGFDRLGGFDEGYFLHVEDVDLCRRAEADGGTVIYTPLASALHHGATSDAPAIAVERHKASGLSRYFNKFAETPSERLAARILAPVITWALLLRAAVRRRGR